MAALPLDEASRIRTALLFILVGLVVQTFCLYEVTPGRFMLFALISVPLVLAGIGIFLHAIWRVHRQSGGSS